ncbi:helix-turn-helix transcriptional regulator [Duganella sp. Root336D2]|uniref:helix-turn-helix transcriptional regulator n=1 Tax=Duganella sp. Root336D2 TaxID=1736518 RepID=UPI0006FFDDAE|nr:AraC family transcriptional regulator [Duganella sp. Root336D2]KQV45902.1 AraC family transcriptional regulator [Duganella sp. Root336D2]
MKNAALDLLTTNAKRLLELGKPLPFSIYSSVKEQKIVNVPIIKPMLICVLDGSKKLGNPGEIDCLAGSFIILSNRPSISMRNIPSDSEYRAMIVEFEFEDFHCLPPRSGRAEPFVQGQIGQILLNTLRQFVEWSSFAPPAMWGARRQEILQLVYHLGYEHVSAVVQPPSLSHKVHSMISADFASDLKADEVAGRLALSESTLRRKLAAEGVTLQAIKDRAKLGYGLHLVQTTFDPIGRIAEKCGYQSQSRFTDKFKQLFGTTPTELRKTRMPDEAGREMASACTF